MDEIIDDLKKAFEKYVGNSAVASQYMEALQSGAGYPVAYDYADEIGLCLENAMRDVLGKYMDTLQGELTEKQVWALLCSSPSDAYKLAMEAAELAQTNANKDAGIGIKALATQLLGSRLKEDVEKTAKTTLKDSLAELLSIGRSLPGNAVADTLQKNADFQKESGLSPKIVRTMNGETCSFCAALAGTYDYPCDKKVYVRHANCDCTVNYFPNGTGMRKRYQDVHGKRSIWKST